MKKLQIQTNLPLSVIKEGNRFIAYTPALDLSTSGKTYEEAKKRFNEAVSIFFEEIIDEGNAEEVLSDLGWTKVQKKWSSPLVVSQESQEIKV
ncbi:MAG: type II toxin-antitoxin system HicB family antitoxin [Candidatus Paceibacterota bacterium]